MIVFGNKKANQIKTGIRKRVPIRRRFLIIVLSITIISILAVSVTGFFCIRWIRGSTEQTLMEQLEVNLKNNMQEKAGSVSAKLQHYEKYIEFITETVENMYSKQDELIASGRVFDPPKNTDEYELTRAFASSSLSEEQLHDEILFFSHLEDVWSPIIKENEGLITTVYLGTKDGLLASYDAYSYLSCPPEGKETIYNYYVSEWYKRGIQEDDIFYTGVYMDSQGRGLTITIASGFKNLKGETVGVVCMDFDLTELYNSLYSPEEDDGTFIFTLDHNGTIISPDSDILDLEEYTGLTLDDLDKLKEEKNKIMEKNDSIYISISMEPVDWLLCARVPKQAIQKSIYDADKSIWGALAVFAIIVFLILMAAVLAVNMSVRSITYPLELLRKDIKIISDGNLKYRASVYRNDEIGDITSGMNEMVDRLNFTLNELKSTQREADAMSKLATLDALTGVRNKTAFDSQSKILAEELKKGQKEFGFALLDLNNLKEVNDNYGHDKGDIAIKNLCHIACEVFAHSPVFRIGGDEFVVLLKNDDYKNIRTLMRIFKERIHDTSTDMSVEPWDRTSSAIGYALYDERIDTGLESVLARADKEMYACKKKMKGSRR